MPPTDAAGPPTDQEIEIHGYVTCPFAWRVRLAAAEKGVPADWIPCDVDNPDPRAAAHNPDEHSPLLYHQGFTLLESEVITLYLDERFTGPPLLPVDPRARAEARFTSAKLAALDVHLEHSRPEARRKAAPALQRLESRLGDYQFITGAALGLADVLAWPFLANLVVRGLLDTKALPRTADYVARMSARPGVKATRPPWAVGLG